MPLADLIDRFQAARMVVLGDLAVDCYVETAPARLSREAPVMVLRYEGRRFVPGCAANTVMNLRQLGAEVVPIGIVGDDEAGAALLAAFAEIGISTAGIVVTGRSVVKVRLMSGDPSRPQQQVVRVDMEPEETYGDGVMLELIARAGAAEGAAGIVVSDYGYGAASPGLLRAARGAAHEAKVSVDSRSRIAEFPGTDLLTPNEWELARWLGRPLASDEEAAGAAAALREQAAAAAVLLTRGNAGMLLVAGETHRLPVSGTTEIVDPSGAGDTVVATAALARACGATHLQAARLANHAAGVTVMKSGAAGLSAGELREAVTDG